MGMVTRLLVDSKIDWPMDNTRIVAEDNIGDDEPIHIHIHQPKEGGWGFRLHFTYDEFKDFSKAILEGGKL
jgi:hypothetical protein